MSEIIFGVFEDRDAADAAVEAVERESGSGLSAFVHEEHLRDEDVQMIGTNALRGALLGAAVVGVAAALIGGLIMIPRAGLSIGWTEWVFLAIAGTVVGVTAGAVAGASESREEIRAMASSLDEGKVLLTMETDEVPTAAVLDLLRANGALEVKAA